MHYPMSNFHLWHFANYFWAEKIFFDEIYAIINVSLIIHYYSTQYVMIKWKTLTLSCNCPLVTSFFIHRSFVLWTKFLYLLFVHTLYSSTPRTTLLYFTTYVCIYANYIKSKGAYHIFYVKGTYAVTYFHALKFNPISTIIISFFIGVKKSEYLLLWYFNLALRLVED